MKNFRWLGTAVLSAFLVVAPAPAGAGILDFFSGINVVSVEQEQQFGQTFAQEIEKKNRFSSDTVVRAYVNQLGKRLVGAIQSPEFRYRFRVIEDRSVNAFNTGGGWIYVHTGLLQAAETEGQVASVLAHEIGHQVKRHVAKQISRDQLFQTLASFAVGGNSSQWLQLAAGLGITTGQLHFTRDAERDADRVMVDLMVAAGQDPNEALRMFERLRALERGGGGGLMEIFSSHPATDERIQNVRAKIASKKLPRGLARDSDRFREVRARLGR